MSNKTRIGKVERDFNEERETEYNVEILNRVALVGLVGESFNARCVVINVGPCISLYSLVTSLLRCLLTTKRSVRNHRY